MVKQIGFFLLRPTYGMMTSAAELVSLNRCAAYVLDQPQTTDFLKTPTLEAVTLRRSAYRCIGGDISSSSTALGEHQANDSAAANTTRQVTPVATEDMEPLDQVLLMSQESPSPMQSPTSPLTELGSPPADDASISPVNQIGSEAIHQSTAERAETVSGTPTYLPSLVPSQSSTASPQSAANQSGVQEYEGFYLRSIFAKRSGSPLEVKRGEVNQAQDFARLTTYFCPEEGKTKVITDMATAAYKLLVQFLDGTTEYYPTGYRLISMTPLNSNEKTQVWFEAHQAELAVVDSSRVRLKALANKFSKDMGVIRLHAVQFNDRRPALHVNGRGVIGEGGYADYTLAFLLLVDMINHPPSWTDPDAIFMLGVLDLRELAIHLNMANGHGIGHAKDDFTLEACSRNHQVNQLARREEASMGSEVLGEARAWPTLGGNSHGGWGKDRGSHLRF